MKNIHATQQEVTSSMEVEEVEEVMKEDVAVEVLAQERNQFLNFFWKIVQ